jgi:FAD/FMN-containing dehydrogenase
MSDPLVAALRAIVGAANVLTHDDPAANDLSAWEKDWRGLAHGRALAVVRPASTQQVSEVVKACAAQGVAMVPEGDNTGLVAGSRPPTAAAARWY